MKNLLLAFVFLAGLQLTIDAQQTKALKKVIELQMPKGEGNNGASVIYHPIQKKYYASFAGNAAYPLCVFDIKGKRISTDDLKAGFDVRSLWYNSSNQALQGNGYNDFGWTNFTLDKAGIPTGNEVFMDGMNQPGAQSVGAFDDKNKMVYFLSDDRVAIYNFKGQSKGEMKFTFDEKNTEEVATEGLLPEKFNSTNLIFTGIDKAEWGLLDIENKKVFLFNRISGKLTQQWTIDSPTDFQSMFGFAYTNGLVFIFNKAERKWEGYK